MTNTKLIMDALIDITKSFKEDKLDAHFAHIGNDIVLIQVVSNEQSKQYQEQLIQNGKNISCGYYFVSETQ